MKTKFLFLIMMALFVNMNVMSQNRIDKIIDELEEKGVDVSKVVKRDPKTKKVYSITKSLSFYSKEGKYAERLKEAFKKDADNAITEQSSNHGTNVTLIFQDGKKKTIYTLHISNGKNENPLVNLNVVFRDHSVRVDNDLKGMFYFDSSVPFGQLDSLLSNFKGSLQTEKYEDIFDKYFNKQQIKEQRKTIIDSIRKQRPAVEVKRSRKV